MACLRLFLCQEAHASLCARNARPASARASWMFDPLAHTPKSLALQKLPWRSRPLFKAPDDFCSKRVLGARRQLVAQRHGVRLSDVRLEDAGGVCPHQLLVPPTAPVAEASLASAHTARWAQVNVYAPEARTLPPGCILLTKKSSKVSWTRG